jgi:hypothetical protein
VRLTATAADGHIGITLDLTVANAATPSPEDEAAAARLDGHHNRWFLDPVFRASYPTETVELYEQRLGPLDFVHDGDLELIAQPIDFLGVNFYRPNLVEAVEDGSVLGLRAVAGDVEHTSMGCADHPTALTELLVRLQRDYGSVPFVITENERRLRRPSRTAPTWSTTSSASQHRRPHRGARAQPASPVWTCAGTTCGRCSTTSNVGARVRPALRHRVVDFRPAEIPKRSAL